MMRMVQEVLDIKVNRSTLWVAIVTLVSVFTSTIITVMKIDDWRFDIKYQFQTQNKTLYDYDLRIKANSTDIKTMSYQVDKIGYDIDNYKKVKK